MIYKFFDKSSSRKSIILHKTRMLKDRSTFRITKIFPNYFQEMQTKARPQYSKFNIKVWFSALLVYSKFVLASFASFVFVFLWCLPSSG